MGSPQAGLARPNASLVTPAVLVLIVALAAIVLVVAVADAI
jgi:hypothetical protein